MIRLSDLTVANRLRFTAQERFHMSYIPVTESGCWLWVGATNSEGYGRIGVDGRKISAHRFSWMMFRGTEPGALEVCHRCDVISCVNPYHLFLGTHTDNVRDCLGKGRNPTAFVKGQRPASARLTDAEIRAIRADTRLKREIAADYRINPSNVSHIQLRRSWRHIS